MHAPAFFKLFLRPSRILPVLCEFDVLCSPCSEFVVAFNLCKICLHSLCITLACGDDGFEICRIRAFAGNCLGSVVQPVIEDVNYLQVVVVSAFEFCESRCIIT